MADGSPTAEGTPNTAGSIDRVSGRLVVDFRCEDRKFESPGLSRNPMPEVLCFHISVA